MALRRTIGGMLMRAGMPMLALGAAALAGCSLGGTGGGVGSLLVDPARYDGYRCDQLATEATTLANREKDLRNLIDRASEGGGGTVIGALAYRSDYEAVLAQERLVARSAVDRKCQPLSSYNPGQPAH